MRAINSKEILSLYKNGRRDFRRLDLSGQDFSEEELSGADFSFSNIQSTRFKSANLSGTSFVGVKAGINFKFALFWTFASFAASFVIGCLVSFSGINIIALILRIQGLQGYSYSIFFSITFFVTIVVLVVLTSLLGKLTSSRGMTVRKFIARSNTLLGLGICLCIAFVSFTLFVLRLSLEDFYFYLGSIMAGLLLGIACQFLTTGVATAKSIVFLITEFLPFCWLLLAACSLGILVPIYTYKLQPSFAFLILISTIISILIGSYTGHGAVSGDPLWAGTLRAVISLLSIYSTTFKEATLDGADFSAANLKLADLRLSSVPYQVKWLNISFLEWARLKNTLLEDLDVRRLMISGQGDEQDFSFKDLRKANLANFNFRKANLTDADISNASLSGANLQDSDLTRVKALGTNFGQATLTGACLEAWGIDHSTQITSSICQYIYLSSNSQERRPSSGFFEGNEFGKLFEKVLNTIDIIFRDGVDWKVFVQTLDTIQVKYKESNLQIQSLENKGNGVLIVKLQAAPEADKFTIHQSFVQRYKRALKTVETYKAQIQYKDRENKLLLYEYNANMKNIAEMLAKQQQTIIYQNIREVKAMQGNDYSHNINIGGDATGSAIQAGNGNTSSIEFQKVILPPAESINIRAEILALQEILASFNRPVIDSIVGEMQAEVSNSNPDKSTIANALETGLTYSRNLQEFAETIDDLRPHVQNAASWLGEYGKKLLPLVGLML